MRFCPVNQNQRNKFRTVIHAKHRGVSPICCDPVEHTIHSLGQQVQVYFDQQSLAIKIIDDIKRAKASTANQRVMHKINRSALVQRFRCGQRRWATYRQTLFAFATKIQFQQAVNAVDPLMVPLISLPLQNLKKLREAVSWISFSRRLQRENNGIVTRAVRTSSGKPFCSGSESCRPDGYSVRMSLSDASPAHAQRLASEHFFDNVFQCPIFKPEVGKHLLKPSVLVLKIFYLLNIRCFHATVFRLPVIVCGFRDPGLPADVFHCSSGFNRLNYRDDLMLSKTGFTHSDLLRWQNEFAARSLNLNGTIMRDTYRLMLLWWADFLDANREKSISPFDFAKFGR